MNRAPVASVIPWKEIASVAAGGACVVYASFVSLEMYSQLAFPSDALVEPKFYSDSCRDVFLAPLVREVVRHSLIRRWRWTALALTSTLAFAGWRLQGGLPASLETMLFATVAVTLILAFDVLVEMLESRRRKAAEPGATDNPDDAQRLREDH